MKKTGYKIGYLCLFNPLDKRTNSGTQWHMINALKENGNGVYPFFPDGFISRLCIRLLYRIYKLTNKKATMFFDSILAMAFYGLYFTFRLNFKNFDLLFISRGSPIIPFLKTHTPIVYTSDATFRLMLGYYDEYTDITESQRSQGEFKERSAISRSRLCIYPSSWAARSAVEHYGAEPSKVVVIPSGANFEDISPNPNILADRFPSDVCRILFVGRDWHVKGGDIALETVKILNANGIPSTLTVIGCKPKLSNFPDWLDIVPFLDKNNKEDAQRLARYFAESHFFVLPTRHETFGLVFAEACAYGLPIIATQTGGVSTSVEDGVNGYLFDLAETGESYAQAILSLWKDKKRYDEFSINAQKKYTELLNWKTWGKSVQMQIDRLLS